MLFWRAKSAKQAAVEKAAAPSPATRETEIVDSQPAEAGAGDEKPAPTQSTEEAPANAIVISPARLTERLAEIGEKPARSIAAAVAERTSKSLIEPNATTKPPGQEKAFDALREAISNTRNGSHVLVLGPAGTGRRSAAVSLATEIAPTRPHAPDWVYAATARQSDVLHAYAVPHGTGERFVRDVQDALAKSSAMLSRLIASDGHQMTLAVLEEEHRQRGEGPLDLLKRRAEAQNIALVKTSDGFMLAPMHEGKVVRADVFRALPDALQRDVEAKVTSLEGELQALLGALPGNDVATDDRHLALSQQTAERAVKPNLAVARKLFSQDVAVADVFDAIEAECTRRATEIAHRGGDGITLAPPGLQAVGALPGEGAPVVLASSISAQDLLGEIGRDGTGAIAIRPGHLSRANGGFLIADAWRLAAEPQAWAALSAALESGTFAPMPSPGLAITAEPVPLQLTLIVIADREAFDKLKAIDPRLMQYFGATVQFEGSATAFDISEETFAGWVAALAETAGFRKLATTTARLLYDDARARAGDMSQVSLDIATLASTLRVADGLAADAARDHIAGDDVKAAIARRPMLEMAEAVL